jgi:hypothetical protein
MWRKKRTSKRVPFQKTVRFGPKIPLEHTSSVRDLSYDGLCIKTEKVFPPGTKLYISIETIPARYEAEGVVVWPWPRRVSQGLAELMNDEMGVRFTHVDHKLVALYEEKLKDILVAHGSLEINHEGDFS